MATIKELAKNMADMKKFFEESNKTLASTISADIVSKMEKSFEIQIKAITTEFQKQLAEANTKIAKLEKTIENLASQDEITKKQNNIIISGIPIHDLKEVNVNEVMNKVSSSLGFERPPKFHAVKRINNNSTSGTISVKLHDAEDKRELMTNYFKTMKLSVKDVIENSNSKARIYINPDLIKSTFEIQKRAATLRKEKKIFQFRIFNGRVGVKTKNDDAKFQMIYNLQELNQLVN